MALSDPAPVWAKRLAEQAIRDRDVVPVETWPDTPRGEEREELICWMRLVEQVVEAGEKGEVSKRRWVRWGELFDSVPGVGEYFRQLLRELPDHGPQKAPRKRVELATAVPEGVPCMPWGFGALAFA